MLRVCVNGFGTIGKRVAEAVQKQDDMKVVGVSKTKPDFLAELAQEYGLYVPQERVEAFENCGIEVKGTLEEMLQKCDVVVDATPKGLGARYKEKYEALGKKAVFQGGEKASVAQVSFVAQANYERALGKDFVRVVSCNTTALVRLLNALNREFGVKRANVVLIRRSADPSQEKGLLNTVMPKPVSLPSHHAEDVKSVIDLDIRTLALNVPTTLMHVHALIVDLNQETSVGEVRGVLEEEPRIKLVSYEKGLTSTAKLVEWARDIGRKRYDIYELLVWEESISMVGKTLYLFQAVHQEAIVVPENVDALRAMFELMGKEESIKKTDRSLGICSS